MQFHKITSTCLGIGYIGKGAGTVAAIATCIVWYIAWAGGFPPFYFSLIITVAITLLGVWSSNVVSKIWGDDPARVVIDECAGMCISMLFLPVNVKYVAISLILFRFFDILKPLFIKRMESFPGGWGIMFDDVLAGIYTNILLQIVLFFKIF
jgi:phosphatidylglycerophosphatase A